MALHIRQIVLVARDLEKTVSQLSAVLGLQVCHRDPGVGVFGLENALMPIGNQFLEVVSPTGPDTAAGRHLERHGDSGYMLILQTDDLPRDRARLERLRVRIIWESQRSNIAAVHLHPRDLGGTIVSLDQPEPPEAWPWAGPDWQAHVGEQGAQRIVSATMAARDPVAMASRWAEVLGTSAPEDRACGKGITLTGGELLFRDGAVDGLAGFGITTRAREAAWHAAKAHNLTVEDGAVFVGGTAFYLLDHDHCFTETTRSPLPG